MRKEEIQKLRKKIVKLIEQGKTFRFVAQKLGLRSAQLAHYHYKNENNNNNTDNDSG